MKPCPKCQKAHEKPGQFCSRSCANSKTFSEETKELKRQKSLAFWNNLSDEEKAARAEAVKDHRYRPVKKNAAEIAQGILSRDWDVMSVQYKRLRVILEQNGKCNKCQNSHWLGQPISFEYEHKDGNNQNNARDNVEALCPNCHSQTSTWRGRKNGSKQARVEELVGALGFEPRSSPNLGSREV